MLPRRKDVYKRQARQHHPFDLAGQLIEPAQHLIEQVLGGGRGQFRAGHVEVGGLAADGVDQFGIDPGQAVQITACLLYTSRCV